MLMMLMMLMMLLMTGGVEGGLISCPHCGHTHQPGRHVVHDQLGTIFGSQKESTCHVCQGHGEVLRTPKHRCPHCHGTKGKKRKMKRKKYSINVGVFVC